MNELRRMAYLDALGIDSYVSRTQLPGAAVTRRLAILVTPAKAPVEKHSVGVPDTAKTTVAAISPVAREGLARTDFGLDVRRPRAVVDSPREQSPGSEPVPRFTLSAIIAGDWLWLEDLNGFPLTTDQVQLMQSMAQALVLNRENSGDGSGSGAATKMAKPDVAQFDWPMHTNRQLDSGEEAARASVAAFINRRLEQRGCRGLVLLGQACAQRVPLSEMEVVTVTTTSSAQILVNAVLKRQVWRDLQPLLHKP